MCDTTDSIRSRTCEYEAVHHRQHNDQRHHAERDADHRNAGNKRNEPIASTCATAGARVAQPDAKFVRKVQGDDDGADSVEGAQIVVMRDLPARVSFDSCFRP